MKSFKDKVIIITGAGSGIGRALAIEFAGKGAKLALNDFRESLLRDTLNLLSNEVQVFSSVFDVSDEVRMNRFAEDVASFYGRADIMINNAGVAQESLYMDEIETKDYEWLIGVNMWGTIYGSRAFLPYLRKQKESGLVNISSVFGLVGIPGVSSYSVSKFAVRGFSESVMLEERINKTGVTVTCVHPGGIKTNIARSAKGADSEKMEEFEKALKKSPESAALAIIKGIRKKKTKILVGADAYLIYYLNKYAKGILERGVIKNYLKMK
jgi:NAD(P)-dependent dehydrogenase (short-subunit alcohol dehydrogenase family)